ncbi:hypothetical protein HanRHA438_Chr01g0021201 [Helianthus annuus]|nr:hypothetical protein HanRHA438_Chr01g0021201 [Helianthus annuus]
MPETELKLPLFSASKSRPLSLFYEQLSGGLEKNEKLLPILILIIIEERGH